MGESTLDFDSKFPIDTEAKTVVLVGKTGNGKSATGNSIIGADVFNCMMSFGGVTASCNMHSSVLPDGQILNVIDTPGLLDSSIGSKSFVYDIAKCINMAKNGIHALLVVVSLEARFSVEEASAIESLSQFFGGKIDDYMILVFTHSDALGNISIDEFLARKCSEPLLEKTLELCGYRHILFDNVTNDEVKKYQQLEKLLRLVDTVMENNDGIPYTNELFVETSNASDNGMNKFHKKMKIESKVQETALTLEKHLAAERITRIEAEAKVQESNMKLFLYMSDELRLVKSDLEDVFRVAERLQKTGAEIERKFKEAEDKFKNTGEKFEDMLQEMKDNLKKINEDNLKMIEDVFKKIEDTFMKAEEKLRDTEWKVSQEVGIMFGVLEDHIKSLRKLLSNHFVP